MQWRYKIDHKRDAQPNGGVGDDLGVWQLDTALLLVFRSEKTTLTVEAFWLQHAARDRLAYAAG